MFLCLAVVCAILTIPAGVSGIRKGMIEREQWKSSDCTILNISLSESWIASSVRVESTGIVATMFNQSCADPTCRQEYMDTHTLELFFACTMLTLRRMFVKIFLKILTITSWESRLLCSLESAL